MYRVDGVSLINDDNIDCMFFRLVPVNGNDYTFVPRFPTRSELTESFIRVDSIVGQAVFCQQMGSAKTFVLDKVYLDNGWMSINEFRNIPGSKIVINRHVRPPFKSFLPEQIPDRLPEGFDPDRNICHYPQEKGRQLTPSDIGEWVVTLQPSKPTYPNAPTKEVLLTVAVQVTSILEDNFRYLNRDGRVGEVTNNSTWVLAKDFFDIIKPEDVHYV